uniref:Uncharacterized protein n=1 Tax=Phaeomonas parva TaxID=124430 RepID=A0A7S1XTC0_9STRA|mmetsp:Transcript_31558/g.100151  ORF Transcript_31558/g.100151 Transcript_31558/m.100151 type:complete len:210 (+) Transcript_31558:132-761(+)
MPHRRPKPINTESIVRHKEARIKNLKMDILNQRRESEKLRKRQGDTANGVLAARRRHSDLATFNMVYDPDARLRPSDREYIVRIYSLRDKLCWQQNTMREWFNKYAEDASGLSSTQMHPDRRWQEANAGYSTQNLKPWNPKAYSSILEEREQRDTIRKRPQESQVFPKKPLEPLARPPPAMTRSASVATIGFDPDEPFKDTLMPSVTGH